MFSQEEIIRDLIDKNKKLEIEKIELKIKNNILNNEMQYLINEEYKNEDILQVSESHTKELLSRLESLKDKYDSQRYIIEYLRNNYKNNYTQNQELKEELKIVQEKVNILTINEEIYKGIIYDLKLEINKLENDENKIQKEKEVNKLYTINE